MDLSVHELAEVYKTAAERLLEELDEEQIGQVIGDIDHEVSDEVRSTVNSIVDNIFNAHVAGNLQESASELLKLRTYMIGDPEKNQSGNVNAEQMTQTFFEEFINEPEMWEWIENIAKGDISEQNKEVMNFIVQEHLVDFVSQDGIFQETEEIAAANP